MSRGARKKGRLSRHSSALPGLTRVRSATREAQTAHLQRVPAAMWRMIREIAAGRALILAVSASPQCFMKHANAVRNRPVGQLSRWRILKLVLATGPGKGPPMLLIAVWSLGPQTRERSTLFAAFPAMPSLALELSPVSCHGAVLSVRIRVAGVGLVILGGEPRRKRGKCDVRKL